MTKQAIAEVLIKVWAVTLLVSALLGLITSAAQFVLPTFGNAASWKIAGAWNLVYFVITAAIGGALLKLAPAISMRLAGSTEVGRGKEDRHSLQEMAFGVMGVYFAVLGARDGAGLIFRFITRHAYNGEGSLNYLWQNAPEKLVEAIVQTLLGIALFVGRHTIASGWRWLRPYANRPKP